MQHQADIQFPSNQKSLVVKGVPKRFGLTSAVMALTLLGAVHLAQAQSLLPGGKAPAVEVGSWVKGDAVTELSHGIHVIEFWATWCGPCRTAIPHLTELAKKYDKQVGFAGVSVTDRGDVKKFVAAMGDKMDYSVATDDANDSMSKHWLDAAGQKGIPVAFIVKGGIIQWIGHPMRLDGPLADVVAGKWDVAQAKADYVALMEGKQKAETAAAQQRADLRAKQDAIRAKYAAGKQAEALKDLDGIANEKSMEYKAWIMKIGLLASDNVPEAEKQLELVLQDEHLRKCVPIPLLSADVAVKPENLAAYRAFQDKAVAKALEATEDDRKPWVHQHAAMMYQKRGDRMSAMTQVELGLAACAKSRHESVNMMKEMFNGMLAELKNSP